MKLVGFVVAMAVAAITGCSSTTVPADSPPLDGTAWVLSSLDGRSLSGPAATARFEGGRVQGTDGCNRYSSAFSTNGSAIEIGPSGAATQMACPPEVMKQADAFAASLASARSYRVSDGQLQLIGADGAVLAQFAAQPQSLAGTAWRATGINNGKGAVAGLVADSSVTMNFAADGKVSGTGGCNLYTAGYQAAGNTLKFTPAAATRKMCSAPGVMEQEQAFFRALESVATLRMEADRLEMRTAEGALALILADENA
jgi:heat shock protein HslJ